MISGKLQKISFDAEDYPPPSYYDRDGENRSLLEGYEQTTSNDDSNNVMAPVHQHSNSTAEKAAENAVIDKSEWWKAPEFVPRSVQVSATDHSIIHQSPNIARLSQSAEFDGGLPVQSVSHSAVGVPLPLPLPLPTPPRSAFVPLPQGSPWPGNPQHTHLLTTSGTVPVPSPLQLQLARMRIHNPRVMRSFQEQQSLVYQQKLQQLYQQRYQYRLPTPSSASSTSLIFGGPGQRQKCALPAGYTANVTTVNAGIGPPIPAIVLKRRRKKRVRKPQQTDSLNKPKSAENNQKTDLLVNEQFRNGGDRASSADDDDTTASSLTSAPSSNAIRRSEPDLTKIQHQLIGNGRESLIDVDGDDDRSNCHQSNFPADLDLIQTTEHCVMITGSCPDLSMDAILSNGPDRNNPFSRLVDSPPSDNATANGHYSDEFELDTNPVLKSTLRDLAAGPDVRTSRVKELDRQVRQELRLQQTVRNWRPEDWSEPELEEDDDDAIYHRLLQNDPTDGQRSTVGKNGGKDTNAGKCQKSLLEELEEGASLFRNRIIGQYERLPTNNRPDSPDSDRSLQIEPKPAIVHGSSRQGQLAKTELYNDRSNDGDSIIPRATYVEEDIEDERMRITVNALEALDIHGVDPTAVRSALAASHAQRFTEDGVDSGRKRRFSLPEVAPLTTAQSRNCCTIM